MQTEIEAIRSSAYMNDIRRENTGDFDEDVRDLVDWMGQRADFLDSYMDVSSGGTVETVTIFENGLLGISSGAKMAVETTKTGNVGVIGTASTVKSGIYNVESRVCSDGKAYIMEVSPRGGGNRIAELQDMATGQSLIRNEIKKAFLDLNK